jgi:hypothetical protein
MILFPFYDLINFAKRNRSANICLSVQLPMYLFAAMNDIYFLYHGYPWYLFLYRAPFYMIMAPFFFYHGQQHKSTLRLNLV